jgi:hypothetical protein
MYVRMQRSYKAYYTRTKLSKVNQSMNEPKEALIELENKVRDLEARIKKLENWRLVHTSMTE